MKRITILLFLLASVVVGVEAEVLHIVYVSDTHYGITKDFRGKKDVSSREVNRAMIEKINTIPNLTLPEQSGAVGSGEKIGNVEALFNTGDITNRMQKGALSAKESWVQFDADWSELLTLRLDNGEKVPQYLSAGNHEASNAAGLYKLVMPADPTPMVEIYNRMMKPSTPLTKESFDFKRDRIHYTIEIGGVRFIFIALWLDSREIEWVDDEIERIGGDEPILLFSHDAPRGEVKHFINPNGDHSTNEIDRFENILSDTCSVKTTKESPIVEQMRLSRFLRSQSRIKGYFHGDDNYSEFYDYIDPEGNNVIPTFRVDSPMKGNYSKKDESLLSFMLISIDTESQELTAREVFWNRGDAVEWGCDRTISLK